MNILLICKGSLIFPRGPARLQLKVSHGCRVSALTFTSPASGMVEASGAFDEIFNLSDWLKKVVPVSDLEECVESLHKFESEHAFGNLNMMLEADRISKSLFARIWNSNAGMHSQFLGPHPQ